MFTVPGVSEFAAAKSVSITCMYIYNTIKNRHGTQNLDVSLV